MTRDYIKVSATGVEASGRHALQALYGFLGYKLISRLAFWISLAGMGAWGSASAWTVLTTHLVG